MTPVPEYYKLTVDAGRTVVAVHHLDFDHLRSANAYVSEQLSLAIESGRDGIDTNCTAPTLRLHFFNDHGLTKDEVLSILYILKGGSPCDNVVVHTCLASGRLEIASASLGGIGKVAIAVRESRSRLPRDSQAKHSSVEEVD